MKIYALRMEESSVREGLTDSRSQGLQGLSSPNNWQAVTVGGVLTVSGGQKADGPVLQWQVNVREDHTWRSKAHENFIHPRSRTMLVQVVTVAEGFCFIGGSLQLRHDAEGLLCHSQSDNHWWMRSDVLSIPISESTAPLPLTSFPCRAHAIVCLSAALQWKCQSSC